MNLYTLLLVFTFRDLLCAGCCKELISPARWCSKWRSSDAQMTGLAAYMAQVLQKVLAIG